MAYQDETILKAKKANAEEEKRRESRKNLEQEAEESIYDEVVHIVGEEVHFERRIIPELKISILMPECFFRFADDVAKILYPMGNTPSHIFGGQNINFQMLLNQTTHQVQDAEMKSFVEMAAKLIDIMGPKVTIVEKRVEERKKENEEIYHIGMLSFVSRAIDTTTYNLQYYISIQGKILMGSVTFPSKYKKRMIPLAKEVISSIELLEEREE